MSQDTDPPDPPRGAVPPEGGKVREGAVPPEGADPAEGEVLTERARVTDLYRELQGVSLNDPVFVVHLSGWVDAGRAGKLAIRHISNVSESSQIGEFNTERLLDYRAHRPTLHIVNGISADIDWPTIELRAGKDSNQRDILLLSGAEPDYLWRTFVAEVVARAKAFKVKRLVCLGAYPAAAPHTRSTRLTITSPTPELVRVHQSGATLDVAAGIATAIEAACFANGIDSLSLWAQVPNYISSTQYPDAALSLVEGLKECAGIEIDGGILKEQAQIMREQLTELISADEDHSQTVANLEEHHDESTSNAIGSERTLAISEELGAAFQNFLITQDEKSPDADINSPDADN